MKNTKRKVVAMTIKSKPHNPKERFHIPKTKSTVKNQDSERASIERVAKSDSQSIYGYLHPGYAGYWACIPPKKPIR